MLTQPDSGRWVSPEELASELTALNYKIDVAYPNRPYDFIDDDLFGEVSIEQLYEDMFEVMDVRIAAVKHLIETREVDYFYCLLKSVDIIQHAFWAHMEADDSVYGEAILDSYRKIDQLVDWLRTERPDSNIVLFSDHGGQARPTQANNVMTRLIEGIASPVPMIPGPIKRLYGSAKRSKETWDGEIGNPGRKTGIHRNEAVFIADGPNVTPCSERLDVAFEDITPTLLALLGEPIPEAYIGEPIRTLIKTDCQYTTVDLSVNRSVDITIKEQERISERLHNLGYADMVDK
jgi:predicted AlkP superfamily phosphohydrolase/phosphomutase